MRRFFLFSNSVWPSKKRGSVFSTQIFTFFMGSSVRNALLIALLTPSFSPTPTWKNSFCQFDDDLECPVVVFAAFTFKAKTQRPQ